MDMSMQQVQRTPGTWKKWRLAPDSDPEQRLIIVTEDGETEVCGIVYNEDDADLLAAAPALYDACKAMQKSLNGSATDFAGMLNAHRQLDAAVALVDGPTDRTEGVSGNAS